MYIFACDMKMCDLAKTSLLSQCIVCVCGFGFSLYYSRNILLYSGWQFFFFSHLIRFPLMDECERCHVHGAFVGLKWFAYCHTCNGRHAIYLIFAQLVDTLYGNDSDANDASAVGEFKMLCCVTSGPRHVHALLLLVAMCYAVTSLMSLTLSGTHSILSQFRANLSHSETNTENSICVNQPQKWHNKHKQREKRKKTYNKRPSMRQRQMICVCVLPLYFNPWCTVLADGWNK